MTNENDNAFPVIAWEQYGQKWEYQQGLTKREYFAAMAMQGFLSSIDWCADNAVANESHAKITAKVSIQYADALINELNKNP